MGMKRTWSPGDVVLDTAESSALRRPSQVQLTAMRDQVDVEFTAGGATQEVSSVGGEGAIGQVDLNADVRLLGYCASARLGVQLEVRDGC